MTKKRVMIFSPVGYGVMDFQVTLDWMSFMYWCGKNLNDKYEFFVSFKAKLEQSRAREEAALESQQMNMDYILMIDDDQVFDIHNNNDYSFIETMLNTMELNEHIGVLGAMYMKRQKDMMVPCSMIQTSPVEYRFLNPEEITFNLQEVDAIGGGCMLIRVKMLDELEQPIFIPEAIYSTDIQLCRKAKEAGYGVYLDSELQIGHLMTERDVISIFDFMKPTMEMKDDIDMSQPQGEILKLI